MSFPAPAVPPVSNAGDIIPPAELTAPSPANDEITPPPSLAIASLPPLVAPPLPIVVGGTTPPLVSPILSPPLPTPTLSPISQPQPQPQPQPRPQPQSPLATPTPMTKSTPPPEHTSPPNINSPPLGKPINMTPPPHKETPPPTTVPPPLSRPINITPPPQKDTPPPNVVSPPLSKPIDIKQSPPNVISPPLSKPINIKPPPPTSNPTIPYSPPSPPATSRRPKMRPATQPSPSRTGPQRPKSTPATPTPTSPLPASAALPSSPPVALPVPQSPGAGAWIPFSTEAPTPLPVLPGPPGTLSTPAAPLHGSSNGASSSSGDHQNIQAAAVEPKGSNNGANGVVVGLAVGGVLLLLLAAVCGILLFFYKRKKNFDDYGSGGKHAPIFGGFEEKSSLPQYTKQGSNGTQGQRFQTLVNISTPKGSSMDASGTPVAAIGLIPGSGLAPSSGTFTYEELMRATNDFSEQNLLGQGGFGYVHKGVLPNGKEVAIKQLKMGGHQGEREFRAEVETISQVHHKHLVSLVGYCIAGAERLLIYEYVPNNTLEFHLNGEGQPVMDWPTRLKIAIGAAKGLAYLHEDCSPSIIHRDIKAANILLDFNFEAKVSDFGLAKIFSSSNPSITHMTTRVVGTFGYLAPEYASSGKVTDKSDIYSYGVMLLELITGRPPISNFGSASSGSLVNWARPLLAQAIGDGKFDSLADTRLQSNYDVNEMASMVACAAACVRLSAWRRPKMSQVVRALEGNLSTSELDDGMRPGQSSMHFPYESLDFDARYYLEDMKRMALTNNNSYTTTSRYSVNTSEYGLHPSASSTDSSQPGRI